MTDRALGKAGFFNHRVVAADQPACLAVGMHHKVEKQPDGIFHAAVVLSRVVGYQPTPQRCPPVFCAYVCFVVHRL